MRATVILALVLFAGGLSGCGEPEPRSEPSRGGAREGPAVSIKAVQALALINEEVETLVWDSSTEGGRDRGSLEIELHSLDGQWRWWSRQRRVITNGEVWSGIYGDTNFAADPVELSVPVEVTQGADERWDVIVSCRAEPCFRMTGSEAQAEGDRATVEAALDAPSPVDQRIPAVFFPFETREQAERVAQAMNDLLELQGATRRQGAASQRRG